MGLFKRINISVSKYVSFTGSDANTGTISSPYATITKAASIPAPVLFTGIIIDNPTMARSVYGDNSECYINGNLNIASAGSSLLVSLFRVNNITIMGTACDRLVVLNSLYGYNQTRTDCPITSCFIQSLKLSDLGYLDNSCIVSNNTIINYYNYLNSIRNCIKNSVFTTSVDLYNFTARNVLYYPIFQNCLFRKSTIWKWNGVTIPINYGTYGNTVGDYMSDVISGLYAYASAMGTGADKTYFLAMIPTTNSSNIFYIDTYGQTCKVIEDRPSVGDSIQIFNRYVADSPVDYSLSLSSTNPALTMSDQQSYVGCYMANASVLSFGDVINVNTDGTDDLGTTPDMLISDGNGKFHVSVVDSVQIRNRVRSNVFNFKRGFNLTSFQSQIKSGLSSRFSIGKFQPYNVTDAPTLPMESLEVIPYDTLTTPSAYPKFSANFNGVCQIWYKTSDNTPLLFSELLGLGITTDKDLDEYGSYAVSNADYETYTLSTTSGVTLKNVPVYFAQVEINLNYYV